MAQWDNYSTKAAPADSDTMMIKDNAATGKPNKRVLFSGLWDWIVSKLANAVINSLTTNPKTVTGGMNALQTAVTTLNSKAISVTAQNGVQFANGLRINWGTATIPIGSDRVAVWFSDAPYGSAVPSVTIAPEENGNGINETSNLRIFDVSGGKFTLYNKSGNVSGQDIKVFWIAIGIHKQA